MSGFDYSLCLNRRKSQGGTIIRITLFAGVANTADFCGYGGSSGHEDGENVPRGEVITLLQAWSGGELRSTSLQPSSTADREVPILKEVKAE
jgi:hypothetical protein